MKEAAANAATPCVVFLWKFLLMLECSIEIDHMAFLENS